MPMSAGSTGVTEEMLSGKRAMSGGQGRLIDMAVKGNDVWLLSEVCANWCSCSHSR